MPRPARKSTPSAPRRTTFVPVTTMEEVEILTDEERAELLASLKEAEAEIEAGKGVDYDAGDLRRIFEQAFRSERTRNARKPARPRKVV